MKNHNINKLIEDYNDINENIYSGETSKAYKKVLNKKQIIDDSFNYFSKINEFISKNEEHNYHLDILGRFGGSLIDIGANRNNQQALNWGVKIYECIHSTNKIAEINLYPSILYNYSKGLAEKLDFLQGRYQGKYFINSECISLVEKTKNIYRQLINLKNCKPEFYVNYGNFLEYQLGRSYESLECYDKALELNPNHSMAFANRGETLFHLAEFSDSKTAKLIVLDSYFSIKKGIMIGMDEAPRRNFEYRVNYIQNIFPDIVDYNYKPCNKNIQKSANQFQNFYKIFCQKERLYLNPLSIGHTCEAALHDPLIIKGILTDNSDKNKYYRFQEYINRLKQEYVFARLLAAQSHYKSNELLFVDEGVALIDTKNDVTYNIFIEHARVAYRVAFSLLDKIAYIINDYFKLGFDEKRLSFQFLSFNNYILGNDNIKIGKRLKKLYPIKNPFLAAIIDLANDFSGEHLFQIKDMRHRLEHRFFDISAHEKEDVIIFDYFRNVLLQLLRLTKSAIFYTVLMIDWEEGEKLSELDGVKINKINSFLIKDKDKHR